MNIFEIALTGFSLAMDAFTISICKGIKKNRFKDGIIISLFFGLFQFLMPLIGFYLGNIFSEKIINYNYYLSTILLIAIGILMLTEDNINEIKDNLKFNELIILSFATSIDALVIGISFSFLKSNIFFASIIIGIITFIMCFIGYHLGHLFNKNHQYTNYIGGITLIILGIKILIEKLT